MLRASVFRAVVLLFMILMLPAHGSQPLQARQPPGGAGPSTLRPFDNLRVAPSPVEGQEPQRRAELGRGTTSSVQAGRSGQPPAPGARPPSIDERTGGMQKLDGFFPLYWDDRTGSLLIEIPRFDSDVLFSVGLAAGLGSNDIGLDRGSGGGGRIVSFQRVGPRVLLVQPNLSFRSSSPNALERSRSKIPSRSRCCGDSRWRPRATAACWSTPPTSCCAT